MSQARRESATHATVRKRSTEQAATLKEASSATRGELISGEMIYLLYLFYFTRWLHEPDPEGVSDPRAADRTAALLLAQRQHHLRALSAHTPAPCHSS